MASMRKQYGSKKGKKVFYAFKNKGTIEGVEKTEETKMSYLDKVFSLDEGAAKRVNPGEGAEGDEYVSGGKTGRPTLKNRLLKQGTKKGRAMADVAVKQHTTGPKGKLPDWTEYQRIGALMAEALGHLQCINMNSLNRQYDDSDIKESVFSCYQQIGKLLINELTANYTRTNTRTGKTRTRVFTGERARRLLRALRKRRIQQRDWWDARAAAGKIGNQDDEKPPGNMSVTYGFPDDEEGGGKWYKLSGPKRLETDPDGKRRWHGSNATVTTPGFGADQRNPKK